MNMLLFLMLSNGWVQLVAPLFERETDGSTVPNDEGFVLFPTTWGGGQYNNSELDYDKIVGFNISAITTGWDPTYLLPADSLTVLLINLKEQESNQSLL
jgi:hypothetical protein